MTNKIKLYLASFLFIASTNLAFSQSGQWTISPTVSLDWFKAREFDDKAVWIPFPGRAQIGFSVGILANRRLCSDHFFVETGIVYTRRRWKMENTIEILNPFAGKYESVDFYSYGNLNLLRIPVRFGISYSKLQFSIGPSFDFTGWGRGAYRVFPPEDSSIGAVDINPQPKPLALSLETKLAYYFNLNELYSIGTHVFYHYMLTQGYKSDVFGDTNVFLRSYGIGISLNRHL